MEENKQENTLPTILRQEDISQVIKHFSFTIQQRFEEIQKNFNYFSCLNSLNYERTDLQKEILRKYNDYKTSDEHQIKLLEKFVQRVLQIFQFFRQKTDEPQILQQMSQKITQKLRQIMKNQTSYHFFVNNRPKTQTINAKLLGNRSVSNDFLSIVGPGFNKPEPDINAIFINNKKITTQTPEKRIVEVGKLFKCVFSVLKRGYLVKLRMQRPDKKSRTAHKDSNQKTDENNTTISVEGTCAILRNCAEKGNKENSEVQVGRNLSLCKEKLTISNPLAQLNQNKRQFQISQKIKNRSVSTNHYSILWSQNPSTLKQPSSKVRDIDKKVNILYEMLNIEKYSVVRVAKDPQMWRKDQVKRNQWMQSECKRYTHEYTRWKNKDKSVQNQQQQGDNLKSQLLNQIDLQLQQSSLQYYQPEELNSDYAQDQQLYQNQNPDKVIQDFALNNQKQINQYPNQRISLKTQHQKYSHHRHRQYNLFQDKDNFSYEQAPTIINFKTQQNQFPHSQITSAQNQTESNHHTILVCSSRPYSKIAENVLTDKSSNLMDVNLIKNGNDFSCQKSKSTKQQKKALRLNLPSMLGDRSNLINEPNQRVCNNLSSQQKNLKISQKSQHYLQNYHNDSNDDNIFVPLLPRRQRNCQNTFQNRKDISIKRKNLIPNFHPLNRCRIFRQKKNIKNFMMIPLMESKGLDHDSSSVLNCKVKNAIF